MARILALDFGLQRIGVAVGDTDSGIAFPREVLENTSDSLQRLLDMIEKERIDQIVIGNPLKRDGSQGDIQESLTAFCQQLAQQSALPLEFVDERYTSRLATQRLHAFDLSEKQQRGLKDSQAAHIMLQEWLDKHSSS